MCNMPSVFEEKYPTARKEHKCYECGATIRVNEKYHFAKGCWDGKWEQFKTCLICNDLRYDLKNDDGMLPPFGDLGEWAAEDGMDIYHR